MSANGLDEKQRRALASLRACLESEHYRSLYASCVAAELFAPSTADAQARLARLDHRRRALVGFLALGQSHPARSDDPKTGALLDDLLDAGLADATADGVRLAGFVVVPVLGGYLLASPPPAYGPRAHGSAYLGPDSLRLASLLPDTRAKHVLDLGTGSGVQGVLAVRGPASVTLTDVDEHALHLAACNAELNHRSCRVLASDCYEALAQERFDLIVSLPPYLPDPGNDALSVTTSGGADGMALLRRILREAPAHLEEGGELIALCQLLVDDDGPLLRSELPTLCPELSCELIVLERHYLQPYLAELSARLGAPQVPATGGDRYHALYSSLAGLGATGVATVLVHARHEAGPKTVEVVATPRPLFAGDVPELDAALAAQIATSYTCPSRTGAPVLLDKLDVALLQAIDGKASLAQVLSAAWGERGNERARELFEAGAARLSALIALGLARVRAEDQTTSSR